MVPELRPQVISERVVRFAQPRMNGIRFALFMIVANRAVGLLEGMPPEYMVILNAGTGVFVAAGLAGALWRHELTFDLRARRWQHVRGFSGGTSATSGSMDEGVAVELFEGTSSHPVSARQKAWFLRLSGPWQGETWFADSPDERAAYMELDRWTRRLALPGVDRTAGRDRTYAPGAVPRTPVGNRASGPAWGNLALGAVLFGVSGLLITGVAVHQGLEAAAWGWRETEAEVLVADVQRRSREATGLPPRFEPRVVFRYGADGAERVTSAIRPFPRTYLDSARAEQDLTPYPVGARVAAYVHPSDPDRAALQRGPPTGFAAWFTVIGLAMAAAGLGPFVGAIRRERRLAEWWARG